MSRSSFGAASSFRISRVNNLFRSISGRSVGLFSSVIAAQARRQQRLMI
jgi:hypothetical protein